MLDWNGALLQPVRPLHCDEGTAMMNLGPWQIARTLGRDLAGTYYSARREDGERATLYLLSGERVAVRSELTRLVELHREVVHPGLVRFRGAEQDGECYLIAEPVDDALES